MLKTVSLISLLGFLVFPLATQGALDRVGDFALLDERGEFHQLSRYRHRDALALLAYDGSCAAMPQTLASFAALQAQFTERGIDFLLLDTQGLSRDALAGLALPLPVLQDELQLVSASLGVVAAGDVLLLNPERLSVFYRGAIAGEYEAEFENALAAVATGAIADTIVTGSTGCEISYARRESQLQTPPDYVTDVAPVVLENCVACHRQGGVGPFAMDSYIMLLGWSPMIREVILNRRMPPMQIDPHHIESDSARNLSAEERQTLLHWIDAGAPRGEGASDPLEDFRPDTESDWQLGEPDFIVRGPEHAIPPTGVLDYYYSNVDLPFTEERWLRAVQYRAGDASVLHHLMTFVTAPGEDFWGSERNQTSSSRRFVAGYLPGTANVTEYPPDVGVRIPAGHGLSMQFHYVTNGQSTVDQTQIGLYFSEQAPAREQWVQAVGTRFVLPPEIADFPQQASHVFEEAVVLTGLRARMNYRGKKMKFVAQYPDGNSETLLSVPAYNYGWQPHYVLNTPRQLPAGTRVQVIGALDNSESNPTNPDPGLEIKYGLNSWEEMFTGYFTYHPAMD
jgi:mono/diheme cytochrome c family protein